MIALTPNRAPSTAHCISSARLLSSSQLSSVQMLRLLLKSPILVLQNSIPDEATENDDFFTDMTPVVSRQTRVYVGPSSKTATGNSRLGVLGDSEAFEVRVFIVTKSRSLAFRIKSQHLHNAILIRAGVFFLHFFLDCEFT